MVTSKPILQSVCACQNARVSYHYKMEDAFVHLGNPEIPYEKAKEVNMAVNEKQVELKSIEDKILDGDSGLAVRIYTAPDLPTDSPAPLIVYFHGGGFCINHPRDFDIPVGHLTAYSKAVTMSVDYRLAVTKGEDEQLMFNHPHPAAEEDAIAAVRWAVANAAAYGADPDKISLMGDSAGGSLALMTAMHFPVKSVVVFYPWVQFHYDNESHSRFDQYYGLRKEDLETALRFYQGKAEKAPLTPLDMDFPEGYPPVTIIAAQCDMLVDEGERLAEKLRGKNIKVTYKCLPGVPHGFIEFPTQSPGAREALQFAAQHICT